MDIGPQQPPIVIEPIEDPVPGVIPVQPGPPVPEPVPEPIPLPTPEPTPAEEPVPA
jgi:hypothetical protein